MGTAQLVFVEDPCGGSRGSDHCACLTGSDVTGSHVTFPLTFPRIFPYFFSRIFSGIFFLLSSRTFFLVVVHKCWLGCSLQRTRPIYIGNYPSPFMFIYYVFSTTSASYEHRKFPLFSYIRCSLRRPRPITYKLALFIICPFPAILFSLSASPLTGYLPLPRHFIFIITLFISIMVFTYGVFGYRLCCVVLQVVYHVSKCAHARSEGTKNEFI
jgi:hypothetical protein